MIGDDGQISSDGTRMHSGCFCSSSSRALSLLSSIDGDNDGAGSEEDDRHGDGLDGCVALLPSRISLPCFPLLPLSLPFFVPFFLQLLLLCVAAGLANLPKEVKEDFEDPHSRSSKYAEKDGSEIQDNLDKLLEETFMMSRKFETSQFDYALDEDENEEEPDEETKKFYKLIRDAHQELYPSYKDFKKLSTIICLLHIKNLHGWSNVSFNMLLQLLNELLPKGLCLPSTYEECKYIIKDLDFNYEKIDTCPNDYILYWKKFKEYTTCPKCGVSKYKMKKVQSAKRKFSCKPRNVRMGLASDGFNSYKTMSIRYSIWPMVLTIYNLLPWDCMKQHSMMLSLLIPSPSSPNRNIDIYLQPLIDELKELWENDFETYDASSGKLFRVHAALLWTISDLPSYSMLSGWHTSRKLACPICNYDTCSRFLKHSKKMCYMGHREFLASKHQWRKDKKSFDGMTELRTVPVPLLGPDILEKLGNRENSFGKTIKRRRNDDDLWTKKSIFFELPYWSTNLLRHNLDVMHIEKNICENIVGTLLNLEGKSKDHLKARLDLVDMEIRHELHPKNIGLNKIFLPPTRFTMSSKEKSVFCCVLKNVKLPKGYGSNISRCVQLEHHKLFGLKSHDYHILMQDLLKIVIRRALPKEVVRVLLKFSSYFKTLCSKVIRIDVFEQLDIEIAQILSYEARLGRPVQYRWMYPIERFLLKLKNYVCNKSCPEGSIAEGYLADECLTFCSRYLNDDVQTKFNNPTKNLDGPIRNGVMISLDPLMWEQSHRYVLFNCIIIAPYIKQHEEIVFSDAHTSLGDKWDKTKDHCLTFTEWFEDFARNSFVSKELKWLSRGPNVAARRFSAYMINGYKFITEDCERKTQNIGVMVISSTVKFRNEKDKDPEVKNVTYYGVLKAILEKPIYENDPFVFATQVRQVYYTEDPSDTWHVVTNTIPRDLFHIYSDLDNDDMKKFKDGPQITSFMLYQSTSVEDDVNWIRDDIPGTTIDTCILDNQPMGEESQDNLDFSHKDISII
ncbi:uncharacterized protein LOC110265122 [Arachis ipaensis]|uniref:uncharacterized protein LOC110265122 n=1 Tax=Arachis ipaensis TaxID=130454 RepID=UPI000A2AFC23|nr:uncharacterized protein LOC110265122 [Arachis ipaensis]